MTTPTVSVIVPAWNGRDDIAACLDSLLSQTCPANEIIVVDNASSDSTADLVAARYPAVNLLRQTRNLGFAGGVNAGIRATGSDIVIMFNQDAVAEPDWLAAMVAGMAAAPDIGIVGCKIYYDGADNLLWHTGTLIVPPRMQPILRGDRETDQGQYDATADMEAVVGAALAVRRSVLDMIGWLDEDFFLYLEDTDLCLRARRAGYRVVYVPTAVARHKVAGSLGKGSVGTLRHYHRSRLLFLLKHFDAAWFTDRFVPAELEWLHATAGYGDCHALREAYTAASVGLLRCAPPFAFAGSRFEAPQRARIIAALFRLAGELAGVLQVEPVDGAWLPAPAGQAGNGSSTWWQLWERPFVSSVPLLGSLIARFRETWNSVAARWYVRGILNQQLQINRRLAGEVETHQRILSELTQEIVSLQRRIEEMASWLEGRGGPTA
jgi:GT2 family glycosyltransferase